MFNFHVVHFNLELDVAHLVSKGGIFKLLLIIFNYRPIGLLDISAVIYTLFFLINGED